MIVISVSARKPARIVRQVEQNLSASLPKIGRLKLKNVLLRIRNKMRGEGKKPTYPIRWDSERQRRAFFATDGFGRGIPTKRTGATLRGWEVVEKPNGFALQNKQPQTKYISGNAYGLGQSRIHQGRWRLLRDVVDEELEKLPDALRAELFVVARRVVKETAAV